MFYVGAFTTFAGRTQPNGGVRVKLLEKLGKSKGRAIRFLKEHKRQDSDGATLRAVVFALSPRFILRNDAIQETIKRYKCDWATAKFHLYREHALDVVATKEEWPEVTEPETSTATEPEPVNPANVSLEPIISVA
jgi:hypothetical protein